MDPDTPDQRPAPSAASLSKTPSWIMLGFLLGAIFVLSLWTPWKKPTRTPALAGSAPPVPAAFEPAKPRPPPQLTTIEAVFAEWGHHAVWSGDTTEVAQWSIRDRDFTEFYEVRRLGDTLYFRSLTRLTRRIIARGKPMPECPLQFTETEEQYREWLEHGRKERSPTQELFPRIDPPLRGGSSPRPVQPPPAEPPPSAPITTPIGDAPTKK